MFEVKKDLMMVNSRVEYPLTVAHAHQFIYINGYSYYLFGDSKVKCDEGDKWESVFGKELAETNATINMLKEYKRILIKFTKQPEWRKEKKVEDFQIELRITDYVRIPVRDGFYTLYPGTKIHIDKKE